MATLDLLLLLEELDRRRREHLLQHYQPYARQRAFHDAGGRYRERLFMAGNQLGKTYAGAAEMAMHLTGEYPDWWQGRRFDRPVRAMCGSESAELTKKGVQRLLLGPPEDKARHGTGYIPKAAIVKVASKPGVPDAVSSIVVKHASGGQSVLQLNSYDQGRSKWQADTVDVVWLDEEPPHDIYMEAITRTNATGGLVYLTFTPLLGMSSTVMRFYPTPFNDDCVVINMTIDDVDHYSAEERARIIASYPVHERNARTRGTPTMGRGRVFPVAEESLLCTPFRLPPHWPRICGIDFGWDHPFAAVWLAWDRDSDTVYVYDCYAERETTPLVHAAAIKPRGSWIPVAWPHDGLNHEKGTGETLADQYRRQGLPLLRERATFADGSNSVEAGCLEMLEMMQTGRFKVFSHLEDWLFEFRLYHRDEQGRIVKRNDDRLSATRYAWMMRRKAITKPRPQLPAGGQPLVGDAYSGY
ncbi:terminase large (ATPase) subunit and inactivated derivatives [Andreprevotia lacus DSM 23236]|uniref:Terminase large (ATPase) subunit and inactivated derivatives n=1 Tax=Andreprevotia lacus DSM 23236 TaxID=1121001 RepID=A0A1W1XTL6_9NEIS|nr:terminase family protein [Andreprevotia lacus]SMC27237.1 terminase large (ATPase) subunit and inactivated derivatives [Andreprevotia lacus DSM 23236]